MSPSDGGRWGNQKLDDYRLTRFGAYLVAMAGDDTTRAVAEVEVNWATLEPSITSGDGPATGY